MGYTEGMSKAETTNKNQNSKESSKKSETISLALSKEIYTKNAVILTVYDFLDEATTLIGQTETDWTVKMTKTSERATFTEELFLKRLNENVAREIINDRTGLMRQSTYMASVTKCL